MKHTINTDLDSPALDLPPVADRIGPFTSRGFLTATALHTGSRVEVVASSHAALLVEREEITVRLAGDPDLTDYHSPLGHDVASLVTEFVAGLPAGTLLDFDSLPGEAADVVEQGMRDADVDVVRERHEVAAVLELHATFDDYLADLSKKQRHEVRRKNRRFAELAGEPRLVREAGSDVVAVFAEMHRAASGDKGSFMTPGMEEHFVALEKSAGGIVDVLYGDGEVPAAAAFGFEDEDTYYLYNSAYEPDLADASPGIVLVASAIADAIDRGKTRFDFLKGDEVYKFRLGAEERPLFRLRGTT
jgi:hypothetical protein